MPSAFLPTIVALLLFGCAPPDDPGGAGSTSTSSSSSSGEEVTTSSSSGEEVTTSSSTSSSGFEDVGVGCGDGVVQDGEECDDGNDDNEDACLTSCISASCGDGVVQKLIEECDDGNDDDHDACLTSCSLASCGDGMLRHYVEECDDGNDDPEDGCDNQCIKDRLVFVTSAVLGAGQVVGLDGADTACAKEAAAFGHPEPLRFSAWLSDGETSPADKFWPTPGRYVLITGEVVAYGWEDLTDGSLHHPIDRTIDGVLVGVAPVWTATNIDGTGNGKHCDGWKAPSEDIAGGGWTDLTDSGWTNWEWPPITCGVGARLLCFEEVYWSL